MSGASARQAARADAGHYSLPTELLDLRAALERLAAARSCSGCNSQAALLEEQPISRWPGTASGCPSEKASAERQDSHPETESQRGNQQREERRNPGDAHEQPAEHTPHEKQEDNGVPRRHKARKQVEEPDAKLQKAGQSGQHLSRGRSERGTETGNDHKSPSWRRTKGTPALVAQTAEGPQSLGVRLLQDIASVFTELRGIDQLATTDLLDRLYEAPWGDLRGKPLDARGLARRLKPYEVNSRFVRVQERVVRGFVTTLTRLPSRAELHAGGAAPENLRRSGTDPRPVSPPLSPGPEQIGLGPAADGR